MIEQIDHIAMGVADIEERIAFFTSNLGMTLGRRGTHRATGGMIAFLWDPRTGFKIELIETPDKQVGFMHVAYRVGDVPVAVSTLESLGCERISGPARLDAAKADTAQLRDPTGLAVQVIRYDPDSPDV